ncbi:hypothetical protein ADK43_26810 [Streptomyces rimosus subsp. rimosus]|nr:hypothetical protein ADK43_26810 [Streptomyces rimosus subsp. rimosus]
MVVGFKANGLGLEPGGQVVGDRLVRIGEETRASGVDQAPQGLCRGVPVGEAATTDGVTPRSALRDIDGERPRAVIRIGEEAWTA